MKIKYGLISLLFLCVSITAEANSSISSYEQQQFDQFIKNIPNQYLARYHTPLDNDSLEKVAHISLDPSTIETYNRDFHTDITLQNSAGHVQSEPLRHAHPTLQKIKQKVRGPISFNYLLDMYARDLPIDMARTLYEKNKNLLESIQQKQGVPGAIALTILGCETGWGNDIGHFPILNSLATLAFKAPKKRQAMYLTNLLSFLHIVNDIDDFGTDKIYRSTFDGGMGMAQFEPDNYLQYAMSYNGETKANIWTSIPDAAASVAYYLHQHGWKPDLRWGYFVKLPLNNPGLKEWAKKRAVLPLNFWIQQGISFQLLDQKKLDSLDKTIKTRLFIPTYYGKADSAFLLTDNFDILMRWNPSMVEGLMIGIISEIMENENIDYNTFKD